MVNQVVCVPCDVPHALCGVCQQGTGPDIEVIVPLDARLRFIIDTMAVYVKRDGCSFEQVGAGRVHLLLLLPVGVGGVQLLLLLLVGVGGVHLLLLLLVGGGGLPLLLLLLVGEGGVPLLLLLLSVF